MNIRAPEKDFSQGKELKIKLPLHQHMQLRTLKLMTGVTISAAVNEALERYMAAHLSKGVGAASMGGPDVA